MLSYRDVPRTTVIYNSKTGGRDILYKDTRLDYDFVEGMIYGVFVNETALDERFVSVDDRDDLFQSWVRRNSDYVEELINERCY